MNTRTLFCTSTYQSMASVIKYIEGKGVRPAPKWRVNECYGFLSIQSLGVGGFRFYYPFDSAICVVLEWY